jgi:micrococcal nuclease
MWLLLAICGLVLLAVGLIALIRGRLRWARIGSRVQALIVLGAASLAFAASMATNPYLPQPGAVVDGRQRPPPFGQPAPPSDAVRGQVVRVVDGDTIVVDVDGQVVTVRYLGVNTPETVDPGRPAQCYGREATARNAALVAGREVHLDADREDRDRFGRLLRYVWVGGTMVNYVLVEEGYADIEPYEIRYADGFRRLRDAALEQRRGLWGACR